MTRRKTSLVEDMIEAAGKLPWWVCIILALVSYLILHAFASSPQLPFTGPGQMGKTVSRAMISTAAYFGQIIIPFAFVMGALLSGIKAFRQKRLYSSVAARTGTSALKEMHWDDFERLVSEYYRRQGFHVTRRGGNGSDGGIDLVLKRDGETHLVQCKQWKAYKVGVQPVREFYGVMASQGAAGGYFVTSGEFTAEAKSFAQGLNLELVDGTKLREMMNSPSHPSTTPATTDTPKVQGLSQKKAGAAMGASSEPPACPLCGAATVKRTARQGVNAGKAFWGCSSFPHCKGIVPILSDSDVAEQPQI